MCGERLDNRRHDDDVRRLTLYSTVSFNEAQEQVLPALESLLQTCHRLLAGNSARLAFSILVYQVCTSSVVYTIN